MSGFGILIYICCELMFVLIVLILLMYYSLHSSCFLSPNVFHAEAKPIPSYIKGPLCRLGKLIDGTRRKLLSDYLLYVLRQINM